VNTILAWRVIHAARAFNRRSLWWIHESTFGHQLAKTKASVSKAFQAADLVMFPSMATANLYREFTDRDNFRVAYSGLRIDRPVEIIPNPKLRKRKNELFLVQVATFERRKGQDILLEAMSRLPVEVSDRVQLFLIGRKYLDRRYYRKILQLARQLKNVTIVGELSNLEVWDYLNAADVFILASRDEALPISMIEAMAIGKAIITTAAGGINEILQDDVNGFVVGIDDSHGLADRITRLVKEPETLERLGRQARRTYEERLSMDEFGRRVQEIIEELPQP
jgi:glycosyltransferase involved in cell wall biosynthesis